MGEPGQNGGIDGLNCWDLNSDRLCSPGEDVDESGACDPADCRGPVGVAGPTGPAGPMGAAGPVGPMGAMGPAGPTGPMGLAGPMGATGSMGPMGLTGMTGAAGATGAAGPQGSIGATGSAGPQGATGATGSAGPQGATGATGATGSAGPQGSQGPQGVPGPTSIGDCPPAMVELQLAHSTLCFGTGPAATWDVAETRCDDFYRASTCTITQWRIAVCRFGVANPGRSWTPTPTGTGQFATISGCSYEQVSTAFGSTQLATTCCLEWPVY